MGTSAPLNTASRRRKFTQTDITRAAKGLRAAGFEQVKIIIGPEQVEVIGSEGEGAVVVAPPVNELDKWLATRASPAQGH